MVEGMVGRVTWEVARGKGALQVRRLPPDFLSGLVASVNLMRLSSNVVGNPEYARDDKVEDGDSC